MRSNFKWIFACNRAACLNCYVILSGFTLCLFCPFFLSGFRYVSSAFTADHLVHPAPGFRKYRNNELCYCSHPTGVPVTASGHLKSPSVRGRIARQPLLLWQDTVQRGAVSLYSIISQAGVTSFFSLYSELCHFLFHFLRNL